MLEKFFLAYRILTSTLITVNDVDNAHAILLQFCQQFEELYTHQSAKPNMHLHCHLHECVQNYGPIFGVWGFSFERYNGVLGSYPTNNESIEMHLMKRFLHESMTLRHQMNFNNFLSLNTSFKDLNVPQHLELDIRFFKQPPVISLHNPRITIGNYAVALHRVCGAKYQHLTGKNQCLYMKHKKFYMEQTDSQMSHKL